MDEILKIWAENNRARRQAEKTKLPVGAYCPWGKIQHRVEHPTGAIEVSTASHGGVKLYAKLNKRVPAELRKSDGWYEEDLDISIPMYFGLIPGGKENAKKYYECYYPGAFDNF